MHHRLTRRAFAPLALSLLLCSACGDDGGRTTDADAGFDAGMIVVDAGFDAGPPEPSELFGPCVTDEQCPGDGAFCRKPEDGWPGGYCTLPCADRGPCDDGFRFNHCLEQADGSGMFCEQRCLNGADCRDGYTCVGDFGGGAGMCVGLCDEDADCEPGGECNEWASTCVAAGESPTTGSETGGPCTDDDGCMSGNCIPPYDPGFSGWANGYCISGCILPMGYNTNTFFSGDALPQGTCAGDAVCFPNGSYTRGDLGVCLAGCTTDADCRADEAYYCLKDIDLPSGDTSHYTRGVCLPMSCQSDPCPSGFSCRTLPTSSGTIYRCEPTG